MNTRILPVAIGGAATTLSPFHSRFAVHRRSPLSLQFADRCRSPPPLAIASSSIVAAFQKVVEVTDMTELETDETGLSHIVELDLVYHALNSSMLGVVAVRYK
ncbi:uncharacterized protein DS421_16g556640 [Arachis hypogaea]|nr:uncharacterized protein DS421_16g556640 [Arachis hypogaea]